MRLTIIELSLQYFKGQTITIPFTQSTFILGKNGTGKTTVYDAFSWLLFGKDSLGRTDYNIKPRLKDGTEIQKTDVSVRGVFEHDGQELVLERRYVEKWTKKRGSEEAEFTGNATEFAINGVSCNASGYKSRIDSIVDEDRFRMVTSATYFNSLKWQDKRTLLIAAAGEPTNEEIAGDNEDFKRLLSYCSGKVLDDFRKELAAKKKPIKRDLDEIPSRMDEQRKNIIDKDWLAIGEMIKKRESELESLDRQVADENIRIQEENKEVNARVQHLYQEISRMERRKMDIESGYKLDYNKQASDLSAARERLRYETGETERSIKKALSDIQSIESGKTEVGEILRRLGAQYEAIASGKAEGADRLCPTCGQEFTEGFLRDRTAHLLMDINKKGEENDAILKGYDDRIKEARNNIKRLESRKDELSGKLEELDKTVVKHFVSVYTDDKEHQEVIRDISSKKEDIEMLSGSVIQPNDLSEVKDRIGSLKRAIDGLKREMAEKAASDRASERIEELREQERKLSSALASIEKTEMVAERFTHKKMDMMTDRINSMFSLVRWRMYESQINGGEKEICECEVDGMPFGSLNTARKVNAGLDIAYAFSHVYNACTPIFVDNRESVTDLIPMDTQVISLVVSPGHETLTIKN